MRKYPTIEVDVDGSTSFHCLNEFSLRSSIIKTFVVDVHVDDLYFETFRGDGLVVSTPTGSTAYNKSLRGAVVDPLIPCFQVSELASLNNNTYRTLGSPFILNHERTLTLKLRPDGNDYPVIGMDNEALSIKQVEKAVVRLSDKQIKTVKLKNNSFWEKVQRTFYSIKITVELWWPIILRLFIYPDWREQQPLAIRPIFLSIFIGKSIYSDNRSYIFMNLFYRRLGHLLRSFLPVLLLFLLPLFQKYRGLIL